MIVITGSVAYDYIMEFPGAFGAHILPEQINNINISFIANKLEKRRGGTAGNASYTMGLLKTPHILFSTGGRDFNEYKKDFKKIGIDTSYVKIDMSEQTATGFAMTDKANNQIWGYYYGAGSKNPELRLTDIKEQIDLVVIGPQGAAGSMSFINQCIKQKLPYMFDPGFILTEVSDKDLTLGITHASIIIGNEYEMNLIEKRVKNFKKISKKKTIITTLGEKGARITEEEKSITIPVVPVNSIMSTTGAGDAWRGGFLSGLQRGYDLMTCGQMGAVASSFAVGHYGTQEHRYSLKAFQKTYRQNFGSLLDL